MQSAGKPTEGLSEALRGAYPELEAVREASEAPVYLVGGAVRDLLLGRSRADLDLVVEGDAAALAARLGATTAEHEQVRLRPERAMARARSPSPAPRNRSRSSSAAQ